jgi:hypothetical protein
MVVTVLLCFGAAESTLRLLLPKTGNVISIAGTDYWKYPGYRTYVPNTHFARMNEAGQSIEVDFDEMGLRNPSRSLASADVIVLGDSMIVGGNTPFGQTMVGELRANGIAAYNAGVDGVSTFGEVHLLRDHLSVWHGRIVVVIFYLGNDFRDNYEEDLIPEARTLVTAPAARSREGLGAVCRAVVSCMWLYEQVYLGLVKGQWHDPMASYALAEMEMLDGRSPGSEIAADKTRKAFRELGRIAKIRDFKVLVAGVPSDAQVLRRLHEIAGFDRDPRAIDHALALIRGSGPDFDRPDRTAAELAHEVRFHYLSLLAIFRRHAAENLFYQIDHHWAPPGEKLAAEVLAPQLKAMLGSQAEASTH